MKNLFHASSFQNKDRRVFKYIFRQSGASKIRVDLKVQVEELTEVLEGEREAERMLVVQARELRDRVAILEEENQELEEALAMASASKTE